MNPPLRAWMAFLGVALLGVPAHAQWLDKFDSYTPGPLTTQSAWETWNMAPGVDANVDATQPFTPANSLRVDGSDDVIYDFANLPGGRPASGKWSFAVKTYVPSSATGVGYVLLLNQYAHSGTQNWSMQVRFDATTGNVLNDGINGGQTPMFKDRWVTLMMCIDLDNDKVDLYYDSIALVRNGTWKDGVSGGGTATIAIVDLYGGGPGGITEFYCDNVRLDPNGPYCLCLVSNPNPVMSGQTLNIVSQGKQIPNGSLGGLFSWSVNGGLFFSPLLYPFYGIGNRFKISAVVPPGLAGLQVGLKSMAAPGGGVQLSNEEVIVFQ